MVVFHPCLWINVLIDKQNDGKTTQSKVHQKVIALVVSFCSISSKEYIIWKKNYAELRMIWLRGRCKQFVLLGPMH